MSVELGVHMEVSIMQTVKGILVYMCGYREDHISYRLICWFTGSNKALKEVTKRVVFEYLRLRSVQSLVMKCY